MTTTLYKLNPIPTPVSPPGRRNGRAGAPPTPPTPTPRRTTEPWDGDLRFVRTLNKWTPWRLAWWVAKDVVWDAVENYSQIRSFVMAHLGWFVSAEVKAERLLGCRGDGDELPQCPALLRRETSYNPVGALANGTGLAAWGVALAMVSGAGPYLVAVGVVWALIGCLSVSEGTVEYCKQCGCGEHPAAELDWKAGLEDATCPYGTWEK